MDRDYTAAGFRDLVLNLRRVSPHTIVRTHLMVGFPGETEDDHQESCSFVRGLPLDHYSAFGYADRPSTPALDMTPKVPQVVIDRRLRSMRRLLWRQYARPHRWRPFHRVARTTQDRSM